MKKWVFDRTAMDMALELNEGVPGALFVLREILQRLPDQAQLLFTYFAAMGMRGELIWATYQVCDEDFQQLVDRVSRFDRSLVDKVNAECEREGSGKRCVHDGDISWPESLPTPENIRKLSDLLDG